MAVQLKRTFYRPHKRVTFDNDLVDPKTGEVTFPPSMAKQEFKAECDINNIIKQFSTTGMIRHVSARAAEGRYEDLPDPQDFQESLHIIQQATDAFMTLPAKVRDRFGQDPHEFLAFVSNPDNLEEMRALGIANPLAPSPEPISVRIDNSGGEGGSPPSEGATSAVAQK